MITPILATERLLLRPLTAADAPHVYKSWTSDPEVARYMIWELHESVKETANWLTFEEQNLASDKSYVWGFVLKETGLLIGSGGLMYLGDMQCYELGYNLMKQYWGIGLTTEASREIVRFAKDTLSEDRIFCRHALDNIGSRRVIEKLGFTYICDNSYDSRTGQKHFDCKDYILEL